MKAKHKHKQILQTPSQVFPAAYLTKWNGGKKKESNNKKATKKEEIIKDLQERMAKLKEYNNKLIKLKIMIKN